MWLGLNWVERYLRIASVFEKLEILLFSFRSVSHQIDNQPWENCNGNITGQRTRMQCSNPMLENPKRIPINELTKRSHAHAHNKITTTHKNYCIQWNLEHHSLPLVACFASFRYITCKSLCSFHFYDLNISYEAYYWYVLFSSFAARSYFLILSISYSVWVCFS